MDRKLNGPTASLTNLERSTHPEFPLSGQATRLAQTLGARPASVLDAHSSRSADPDRRYCLQAERPCLHHILYRGSMYGEGFGADDAELFHWRRLQSVSIGHDVWLGHGVLMMPGAKTDHGAVIGSGSGSGRGIEAVAWWDWTHEELQARQDKLKDVGRMLAAHERRRAAGAAV